MDEEGVEA